MNSKPRTKPCKEQVARHVQRLSASFIHLKLGTFSQVPRPCEIDQDLNRLQPRAHLSWQSGLQGNTLGSLLPRGPGKRQITLVHRAPSFSYTLCASQQSPHLIVTLRIFPEDTMYGRHNVINHGRKKK